MSKGKGGTKLARVPWIHSHLYHEMPLKCETQWKYLDYYI